MLVPLILLTTVQANSQITAAYGVLERTIGPRAKEFVLSQTQANGSNDSFVVDAKGGRVSVKGTTGVAICRGTYEYLKNKCHCFVSSEGSNIHLPAKFPDGREVGGCPVQYRHYYNICTFGYTTAFWDWPRWQREVDWMALHGINMPLALTGQDKIWQTVFKSYGVPQSSLDKFFSGPAFQPWHWMGNLNGHMGPAPQSWLDGQAELQKQILKAERSLGMKPVVPGFSGFVPTDFNKYQPGVKLQSPTAWAGFEPTTFVDIRDPKFIEIGKRFVQEYRKEFGTDHLYLCDTFNEQNPQFPESTKLADLANAGRAVYEGLRQGDPNAIWIMQGWLFYNERDYWKQPEVEALLSKVPDGRMIILDLSGEQFSVSGAQPAVARKGFIYCTLHNFGQNTGLGGDLQSYVIKQLDAVSATRSVDQNLKGFGLTPEGIDQNPVVYEFLCDSMWVHKPYLNDYIQRPSVLDWINDYAHARYGTNQERGLIHAPKGSRAGFVGGPPGWRFMADAWKLLVPALYSSDAPWYRDGWRGRPGRLKRGRPIRNMRLLEQALQEMLEAGPDLGRNPLYQRDLVDVCKTWLGGIADRESLAATQTWQNKPSEYALHKGDFFQTLDEIDRVMAVRPEHRLSSWINQAKTWGKTPEEKRLFERNARMQITAWDGKGVLTDYANKEWAGLTNDFIARRWKLYFESLESNTKPDYLRMEMAWVNSAATPQESKPEEVEQLVREVFEKHQGEAEKLEAALAPAEPPGNIARNGKASDDGHSEPGGSPDKAIDGDQETYWAASPNPRVWSLDLGAVHPVRTIHIFPYCGDARYYQYTVEVSENGREWSQVVDMSRNEQLSSPSGHRHVLAHAVKARYLRVNMLKNSANVGVHLVEVRVFEHE